MPTALEAEIGRSPKSEASLNYNGISCFKPSLFFKFMLEVFNAVFSFYVDQRPFEEWHKLFNNFPVILN